MARPVLLALDVSSARTTEENLLNVSMRGVVDQIQLSFHSFFVFSTFCGAMLIICMCGLVGVTTARTAKFFRRYGISDGTLRAKR